MFLPIVFPFGELASFLAGYGIGRMIKERRGTQLYHLYYPYYWQWYASRVLSYIVFYRHM